MGLLHVAVNQQRLLQKNRFARPGSHQDIGEAPSAGHPENPVSFRPGLDSLAGMKLPLPLLLFLVPVLLPAAQAPAVDLVFAAGSDWEVVSSGHQFAEGMAWDVDGNFIFSDVPRGQLFKVDKATGAKMLVDGATGRANGLAFGPDGRLYGCASGDKCIYAWDPKTWQKKAVTEGTQSNDIAILKDGTIFYTDPSTSQVWRLAKGTFERELAAKLPWGPNGIALSLDQKTLLVAEFNSDTIHGFPIGPDSKISGPDKPVYKLGVPSDTQGKLDGMMVLPDGRLLIGTALGTQVASPVGAPAAAKPLIVIPSPQNRSRNNYIRISPDGEWVYTAYALDMLRRRIRPDFGRP